MAYSVVSGLTPVADLLTRVTGAIGGFVSSAGEAVDVSNIFGKAIDFLSSVLRPITAMFEGLKKVLPGVLELASAIGGVFSKLASKVAEVFESFNTEKAFNILHGGLFAAILIQVEKFINTISNFVFNAGGLMPRIRRIFFNLNLTLQDFQTKLKAEALLKIAGAIAILAGALWLMSTIDSNKLGSSVAAMGALFAQLFGTLAIFQKMSGGFGKVSLMIIPLLLIGISTSILILSAAMKRMSDLDWEG